MGNLETDRDAITRHIEEMEEEHSGEEGLMADAKNDKDKITKASVQKRIKELNGAKSIPPPLTGGGEGEGELWEFSDEDELTLLKQYLSLSDHETTANKKIKEAQSALEKKVLEKYKALTEAEIKTLLVEDKWMAALERDIKTEMDRISQRLTGRIKELAERYETPLPELNSEVEALEKKVNVHLEKMGFVWK